MHKYTTKELIGNGYEIKNARIKNVILTMEDHGVLTLYLVLEGDHWGVSVGGYVLGKGHVGAKEFEGSPAGIEYIMRMMDIVGVPRLSQMEGKYVRAALKGWGEPVKIIGNVIEDRWFDGETFFKDKEGDTNV